jgi:hypothetical protein
VHRVPLITEPDEDEPEFASVWVEATIASRPYRMLLDSGAARSQLPADEYTTSLEAVGRDSSSATFGAAIDDVLVDVRELAVGSLRIPALEVTRGARGPALLGLDVLGQHRCHLRPGEALLDLDGPDPGRDASELLVGQRGHAHVELAWPGVSALGCWDTGAGATVVDVGFWHRHPDLFTEVGSSAGSDAGGHQADTPVLAMAGPEIGGRIFHRHLVVAVDLAPLNSTLDMPLDLIIGYPTIRQADWFFDFPARRWSVTSAPQPARDGLAGPR